MDKDIFTISELAAEFGITPRTIRFYEDSGLIAPRRQGQNRIYSARDRARLMWILRGRRIGFSLAEAAELINLYDLGDGRVEQRRATLKKCRIRQSELMRQRQDLDTTISELDAFCETLERKLVEAGAAPDPVRKSKSA